MYVLTTITNEYETRVYLHVLFRNRFCYLEHSGVVTTALNNKKIKIFKQLQQTFWITYFVINYIKIYKSKIYVFVLI